MLKKTFGDRVAKSLTPTNVKVLDRKMAEYVDRNSEILLSLDLSRRYSFGDADRAVVFDAIGVTLAEMEAAISESKQIYSGNKIQSNPFYASCILAASHFLSKKDDKMAANVLTYMSLMMWTSLHKGFFKYDANKQVMDYTIAHLDNTFLIRSFPSLFAFIQDNTNTAMGTYKARIVKCEDTDITWVVDSFWTRLKGKIKKISSEFYKNHSEGRYLNADSTSYDADEYHEIDNVSFGVDRLTSKVYAKLVNRQYDKRFIKYSIDKADTSYQKLCNLIEDIIDGDSDGAMQRLISAMIEFYIQQSGRPIQYVAKGDFIAYMKTAFSSNTEVAQMAVIKGTVDRWLDENMYKYGKANYGKTLRIQYRRCVYMFFVFVINYEAKLT